MTKPQWRKIDKIWKDKVKEDADFKCEYSGNKDCQLHAHHYIGRKHTSLRWVLQNGFCLSAFHHAIGKQSAHEDPQWFDKVARDLRGKKWYKLIAKLKHKINKFDYETNLYLMDKSLEDVLEAYEKPTLFNNKRLLKPYKIK